VNYSVSCAIINSALKCWGLNTDGLLGDGTGFDSNTPVDVVGMDSGVTDVSVGLRTVCAIKSGGAYCWGHNSGGQLGNGSTTPSIVPVQVSGLTTGVTAISAGYGSWGLQGDSVFAIKDGALYRWGKNDYGQLGNGFTADKLTPELVPELSTNVTSVDTDGIAACAIKDGEVWCFGLSAFLRGIPFDGLSYSPSKVEGVNGTPVQISMGISRACFSLTDEVYCWGFNGDGSLDPSTNDIPSPVLIYSR
jgi:hypothetical protein